MKWMILTNDDREYIVKLIKSGSYKPGLYLFYNEDSASCSIYYSSDDTHYLAIPAIPSKPKSMTNQEIKEVLDAIDSGMPIQVLSLGEWCHVQLTKSGLHSGVACGNVFRVKKKPVPDATDKVFRIDMPVKSTAYGYEYFFPSGISLKSGDSMIIETTRDNFGITHASATVYRAE